MSADEKTAGLAGALTMLKGLDLQDLDYELRKLQGIREWAFHQIGVDYRPGDRVRIVSPIPGQSTDGWAAYAECLHVGATGVVKSIDFALHAGRWRADFVPDREWSVSEWANETRRYWNGPADQTPEGYQTPSEYDRRNYPDGRHHTFMFNAEWLTRVIPPAGSEAGGA